MAEVKNTENIELYEFWPTVPTESMCEMCKQWTKINTIFYIKGYGRFTTICDSCKSELRGKNSQ